MEPTSRYLEQPRSFWSHVKLISEAVGYSDRRTKTLKRFSEGDIVGPLRDRSLDTSHVFDGKTLTKFGVDLLSYLNDRSHLLETFGRPNLMNREQARVEFERLQARLAPQCLLPMNKQKGDKRHYAYLTGIVNMLTEAALGGLHFDQNPRGLVVISKDRKPLRTLTRWYDGAFPAIVNPRCIWEIKEYYGTTTFGSRVADGVYETMLDGYELAELRQSEGIRVAHYLIVDDYFTWWDCGRSYLCRIIDMLHEGLVDEVLFGREVLTRWPQIVALWTLPATR